MGRAAPGRSIARYGEIAGKETGLQLPNKNRPKVQKNAGVWAKSFSKRRGCPRLLNLLQLMLAAHRLPCFRTQQIAKLAEGEGY
jgi:hypothetical protein